MRSSYILKRETDKSINGLGLGRECRRSPNSFRSAAMKVNGHWLRQRRGGHCREREHRGVWWGMVPCGLSGLFPY